jgi:hypothetical protein
MLSGLVHVSHSSPKPAVQLVSVSWSQKNHTYTFIGYSLHGKGWSSQAVGEHGIDLPLNETVKLAATSNEIAFTARSGKETGILLKTPARRFFISRPASLYGMRFVQKGRYLVMMGSDSFSRTAPPGYTTTIYDLKTGVRKTLPYWFAGARQGQLYLVSPGKTLPILYDLDSGRIISNPRGANLIEALLIARNRPTILNSGAFRLGGDLLPNGFYRENVGSTFSPDLRLLEDDANTGPVPARGFEAEESGHHSYATSALFNASGKVFWRIKRGWVYPLVGFHFEKDSRRFAFEMQWPFYMGKDQLRSYPPGLYQVDLKTDKVRRTALPPKLANVFGDWEVVEIAFDD